MYWLFFIRSIVDNHRPRLQIYRACGPLYKLLHVSVYVSCDRLLVAFVRSLPSPSSLFVALASKLHRKRSALVSAWSRLLFDFMMYRYSLPHTINNAPDLLKYKITTHGFYMDHHYMVSQIISNFTISIHTLNNVQLKIVIYVNMTDYVAVPLQLKITLFILCCRNIIGICNIHTYLYDIFHSVVMH